MSEQQRYRVIKRLASGGMAEVFVAESAGIEGFKKQVAIKRVLPQLSKKEQFIAMFLDEARLSAHLSHSNVVSVFDIGVGDGTYFIVMEYVDGADLRALLDHQKKVGRPMTVEVAAFMAAKMCQGLAYAHELATADGKPLQIVHRDITPANVLITRYGEVKIVDFGLAKASSQLAESDAGIIKGKFGYLAPETVLEQGVDQRVDIFALGIILWEMLAGRRLFLGDSDYITVRLVRDAVIPSLQQINSDVPRELEQIIRRALARDPGARYLSARELGRDLTRFLYRYGRPVSEDDVASLVERAKGGPARAVDGTQKIAELIDMMLLEFKSLTKEPTAGGSGLSLLPTLEGAAILTHGDEHPSSPPPRSDGPLGGLADELEGPDSLHQDESSSSVTAWFRGLIPR
ncbi:Protein kinase [Sorangium cellulosum So ce56]|uniref:Protein kinase n=1 Tax=Sorangium cellulosum (strain So ce56) TaxID=448385 RepID=A9GC29_SORC5|nr:serine/threonine-protein kinase [Sorangium cellulosum]CAN96129.1 Protein kinase [Sorangium cellulosum So ce56]